MRLVKEIKNEDDTRKKSMLLKMDKVFLTNCMNLKNLECFSL